MAQLSDHELHKRERRAEAESWKRIERDRFGNRIYRHDFPELQAELSKPRGIVDRFVFRGGRVIECERVNSEKCDHEVVYDPTRLDLSSLKRVVEARAWLKPHCESPIELILGSFLFAIMQELAFEPYAPTLCLTFEAPTRPASEILLIPQFRWGRYRVDFAIRIPSEPRRILFVECDGHDFHANGQQRARDRGRDQEMVDARYPVFRFTGSEICREPEACARSVLVPEMRRLRKVKSQP